MNHSSNSRSLGEYGPMLILGLVMLFVGVYIFQTLFPSETKRTIFIGDTPIFVKVADTPALREKGLSGKDPLLPLEGLLFVFPQDGSYSFWMKDMKFSIDILWISSDGYIVHALQALSPESYPHTFTSPEPARYVLELPSGFMERHEIFVGDKVNLEGK